MYTILYVNYISVKLVGGRRQSEYHYLGIQTIRDSKRKGYSLDRFGN